MLLLGWRQEFSPWMIRSGTPSSLSALQPPLDHAPEDWLSNQGTLVLFFFLLLSSTRSLLICTLRQGGSPSPHQHNTLSSYCSQRKQCSSTSAPLTCRPRSNLAIEAPLASNLTPIKLQNFSCLALVNWQLHSFCVFSDWFFFCQFAFKII